MQKADGTDAVAQGDSGGPVYIKSGSNYLLHGIVTSLHESPTGQATSLMYSTPIGYPINAGFTVKVN